jgi:hypothetical protein
MIYKTELIKCPRCKREEKVKMCLKGGYYKQHVCDCGEKFFITRLFSVKEISLMTTRPPYFEEIQ